eukprot:Gb_10094 [translate_table: standard]
MTVKMEMGIRRLHTLPVLCNKVEWTSLNDSEFPIATELIDLNGVHGLKYTSLRDIMPSSPTNMGSPRREANWCNCTDISIKNHLVKHAARAYLQPMATENIDEGDFFMRCWTMLTNDRYFKECIKAPIESCIGFLSKTFDYLVGQLGGMLGLRRR